MEIYYVYILFILIIFITIYFLLSGKVYKEQEKNEIKQKYIFKENGRKFGSLGEKLTCKIFEEYLGREVEVNKKYEHLKNPETKKKLQYDMYDPHTKIAIEYSGEQHFVFPSRFHKSEKEFYDQVYRDNIKEILSKKNGIKLIVVPYTVDKNSPNKDERENKIREYLTPILDKILGTEV